MRTVTRANVSSVLRRLFDSEIEVQVTWTWDGGVTYRIQDGVSVEPSGEYDVVSAIQTLVDDVLVRFPSSGFAQWWQQPQASLRIVSTAS
jgi:hypothetical protein